jgi:hypothetical protein
MADIVIGDIFDYFCSLRGGRMVVIVHRRNYLSHWSSARRVGWYFRLI